MKREHLRMTRMCFALVLSNFTFLLLVKNETIQQYIENLGIGNNY